VAAAAVVATIGLLKYLAALLLFWTSRALTMTTKPSTRLFYIPLCALRVCTRQSIRLTLASHLRK